MNFLEKIKTAPLSEIDIPHLQSLQPEGWNDIRNVFGMHLRQPYFLPLKFSFENEIIGVGQLIMTDQFAWLGNIIVRKDFQKRSIGKLITQTLMDLALEKGMKNMLLLATDEGKGLYEKFDFQEQGKFIILKKQTPLISEFYSPYILPTKEIHAASIFKLDQQAIGEDRSPILKLHLKEGWIFQKENQIQGFFLPTLGNALTIANDFEAGIELLKYRETFGQNMICLPDENSKTIEFLQQENYTLVRRPIFMSFGKMKMWQPEMIFCRIGGYLG